MAHKQNISTAVTHVYILTLFLDMNVMVTWGF